MTNLTLPTDSAERKEVPLFSGCFAYFPAALAGVACHSKMGNDKHNPGEPMHHARGKSMDHEDCILRHLMDLSDLRAQYDRMGDVVPTSLVEAILAEANALAWRALALSQELHEKHGGAPLAPGAKLPEEPVAKKPTPTLFDTAPFDLKKALEGHPLVTRNGRRVTNFRAHTTDNVRFPYSARIHAGYGTQTVSYTPAGTYFYAGREHPCDILLDLRGVA